MPSATFDELLDAIEHLPAEEQADLLDVVRRRLADRGHQRVIDDVREARTHLADGSAKPASADEIMHEIES